MRVLLVGCTGVIGTCVADVLAGRGHDVLGVSRSSDNPVDIGSPGSISEMLARAGQVDAIACAAGHAVYAPVSGLSYADYQATLAGKALGQIELVRQGLSSVSPAGSFTLITGILSTYPVVTSSAAAAANGAVEAFVRAAALEITPRRINAVCPTILAESLHKAGHMFPGVEPVNASRVANSYVRSIEGAENGQVFRVFGGLDQPTR